MTSPAPLTFRCPRCGARPGQPCTNMPADSYHAMRRVVAHNAESEAERQRQFRIAQEMFKP
jgi:hypothetical protein